MFGSPRSAIRGAVALQQRFVEETIADPSLPLTVGIGLDAGEAVPVEGGYRGGALNVAGTALLARARRRGAREPGDRPPRQTDRRHPVHRAWPGRAEGTRPAGPRGRGAFRRRGTRPRRSPRSSGRPPPPDPHRRRKVVAAVVAFAVVAALIAVPLVAREPGANSEIEPNSIGVLDPESGEVIATVGLEDRPGSVAASADAVWVTNPDAGTVTRIDPDEQAVRDSIPVGENPTGIAVGVDAVWVVESGGPSVSRISPDTNEVVDDDRGRERPGGRRGGRGERVGDQPVRRDDLAHRPRRWRGRRDDPGRARSAGDRGRVRQRVGGAGRVEHGGADRPEDERGDASDRRGQRAGFAGRERRTPCGS